MINRKTAVLTIITIMITALSPTIPNAKSQGAETEWTELHTFTGTCSGGGNVEHRFWVNGTVVEIDINVTWPEGVGANLDIYVRNETGYNVDASHLEGDQETLNIRKFVDRGRWKLVVYPYSCGSGNQVDYVANITVRHIVLPRLTVSSSNVNKGDKVTMELTSPHNGIYQYYFDYGDGTKSGWSDLPNRTKTYDTSGEYTIRGKVMYNDGTESDWVKTGEVKVERGPNMVFWGIFWLMVIGLVTFGVNLAISKRRGL